MSLGLVALAAIFIVAGAMHFLQPDAYVRIVPPWLPSPRILVLVSGAAEVAGGVGLAIPALRAAAGWGLIALLIAVFPANVQMLLDARARHASPIWIAALVLRLPLQLALVWWVWRAAVRQPA